MTRGLFYLVTVIAVLVAATAAPFTAEKPLRIGVLGDMSGLYSDIGGAGSVRAVELAVEDFGGRPGGRPIEVLQADHQNKVDIASAIAHRWYGEQGVDVIISAMGSAVALAVVEIAKVYNKAAVITGASTDALSNEACSSNHVHYALTNHAFVAGTVNALLQEGKKSWYFLVADYAFGHSLLAEATKLITAHGGAVVGAVKHPLGTQDFSSYLLQAQASKAQIIGLANATTDMTNAVRQAREFGIPGATQDIAAMVVFITDVHAIGLERSQNTLLTTAAYWDIDDNARAFAKRFFARIGRMPTFYQMADYSGTRAYLEAAAKVGTEDGAKTIAAMKGHPIIDFFARGGMIREDGVLVHDVFFARVKTPAESKAPWDYYQILATIPGDRAFNSLSESKCPLVLKH